MKQAILITAYKNYHQLEELISFFDENFDIYIHIDKKSPITKKELSSIGNYGVVKFVSRKYKVNWGGKNHLKSILYLSKEALKNPNICFYHLISGFDFPIKSKEDFLSFFYNSEVSFINSFTLPFNGWNNENGGLDRLEYYCFYDFFNWKNPFQRRIIKKIINFQKKIGFKRKFGLGMPVLYAGSTWWSLNKDCLDYVIKYTIENSYVLKRFNYTFCSEEFYFQTVLMNSKFKSQIQNDNLRFIDWNYKNGSNPSILDETDYDKIVNSNSFFARKMEYPVSRKLINKIIFLNKI